MLSFSGLSHWSPSAFISSSRMVLAFAKAGPPLERFQHQRDTFISIGYLLKAKGKNKLLIKQLSHESSQRDKRQKTYRLSSHVRQRQIYIYLPGPTSTQKDVASTLIILTGFSFCIDLPLYFAEMKIVIRYLSSSGVLSVQLYRAHFGLSLINVVLFIL